MLLTRYLVKQICQQTTLVLGLCMILSLFVEFISQSHEVGHGDYGFAQALQYILLLSPRNAYQLLPVVTLIGTTLAFSRLIARKELSVMQSGGLTPWHITRSTLIAACIITAAAVIIGEGVAPHTEYLAKAHRKSALYQGQPSTPSSNIWIYTPGQYIHIGNLSAQQTLHNVDRFTIDQQNRLLHLEHAKSIQYQKDNQWHALQIIGTDINPQQTHTQEDADHIWLLPFTPHLLQLTYTPPHRLSLYTLYTAIQSGVPSSIINYELVHNFWQRLLKPFVLVTMTWLAIPCALGGPIQRSLAKRMVLAMTLGFIYYLCQAIATPLSSIYQLPHLITILLPTAFFITLGIVLAKRT